MHSTSIRGKDFRIEWQGCEVAHERFFAQVTDCERVGVLMPHSCDGLGAVTLIMAYVTAFYDCYRRRGGDFFAYPDFFTFQRASPCADYSMCDIWPMYKNVQIPADAQRTAEVVTARGITVLLVPEENWRETQIAPAEQESAKRSIRRCFAYSASGRVTRADLVLECRVELVREFALSVIDSVPVGEKQQAHRNQWLQLAPSGVLRQSFCELGLSEAIGRF